MFKGLGEQTKNIIFNNNNFSSVQSMDSMFQDLSKLEYVDFSGSDFKGILSSKNMFSGCSSLTSLDLSMFRNNNNSDMSEMFYNCINLMYLNIFNLQSNNENNIYGMFTNLNGSCKICLKNCSESAIIYQSIKDSYNVSEICSENNYPLIK